MFDIDFIYENEIFPFTKAQKKLTFIIGGECINCCSKNYLSIKGLNDILEDGKCIICSNKTKVFNSFLAREVIQKYGFRRKEYFYIKQKFINDIKDLK